MIPTTDRLGAQIEPSPSGGWRVVLPVRAEEVVVEKRPVVYEEVEIRREMLDDYLPPTRPISTEGTTFGAALG